MKKYPSIEFSIDLNPAKIDLKSEGIDIAIRPGIQKDSGLFIRKLDEIQPALFASLEYIKKNGRPKNYEDLKKHKLISTKIINLDGESYKPAILANSMSFVKQVTLESAAIGCLAEEFIMNEKKSGKLVRLFPEKNLPKSPIYLVFTNKKLAKRVSLLVQEIIEFKE
ncbi:MAG: LysR family transcriptional regulator [Pseudomonadota bacterium]